MKIINKKIMAFMAVLFTVLCMGSSPVLAQDGSSGNSSGDNKKYEFWSNDSQAAKGLDSSAGEIWKTASLLGTWGSIVYLVIVVLFFKGKGWQVAPIIFLISFFGEMAVKGAQEKRNQTSQIEIQIEQPDRNFYV